jgi:tryptophanyl-tRNA synthetase
MRTKYLEGNYGYGHAKGELFEAIVLKYAKQREIFDYYMNNPSELDQRLQEGEAKARIVANEVLNRVRKKLGYL